MIISSTLRRAVNSLGFALQKKQTATIDLDFIGKFASAVFVGCARNAAQHLPSVLQNLERWSQLFETTAFVFVENDSTDGTPQVLKRWLAQQRHGHLLRLDGLASNVPSRTARLAVTRNAYLDYVRSSSYANHHYLVVVDFDDVNAVRICESDFAAALDFIESTDETMGVFSNSAPVYYDVWALRHDEWSPDDCWAALSGSSEPDSQVNKERFVYSRQRFLPRDAEPVQVKSAFGGIGVYRLPAALKGRYRGLTETGAEVCEHVPFNLDVGLKGKLYVFPRLRNAAPKEHLQPDLGFLHTSRELTLSQGGRTCQLLAPSHHRLEEYRARHRLYDRRLPCLAAIISRHTPDRFIVDIGANIGDTVALCRLEGCTSTIIAVEPSAEFYWYLAQNSAAHPQLFKNTHLVNAFVGRPGSRLTLCEHDGTASSSISDLAAPGEKLPQVLTLSLQQICPEAVSLIKTDTDGFDSEIIDSNIEYIQQRLPVLWIEVDSRSTSDEGRWRDLFVTLAKSHVFACVFDNLGFLIDHGPTMTMTSVIDSLLRYSRRQRESVGDTVAEPRIYYLDVGLFPLSSELVYREFLLTVAESAL